MERGAKRLRLTVNPDVSGSKPEPAEAKLTPVIISLMLRLGSRYGGTNSLTPIYEADTQIKKKKKYIYGHFVLQLIFIIKLSKCSTNI